MMFSEYHGTYGCESNSPLWNSGNDKDKDIVRQRKRKVAYVSNVLVVSDSKHPEKEGKVFLFKYGQKIFDKVVGALTPEFEDEKPLNPFDPAEGANFKLKMRKVEGYSNFDKSEFDKPAEVGSDKEIAKVLAQLHDLNYFVSKDKFKSYDDLSKKLSAVIGGAVRSNVKSSRDEDEDQDAAFIKEAKSSKPAAKPAAAPADDDDDLAFFAKLAAEE
jgi:hypothetical protein